MDDEHDHEPEWQTIDMDQLPYDAPHGLNVTIPFVGHLLRPMLQMWGVGGAMVPWQFQPNADLVNASGDRILVPSLLTLSYTQLVACGRSTRGPHNVVRAVLSADTNERVRVELDWFDVICGDEE